MDYQKQQGLALIVTIIIFAAIFMFFKLTS